jgi:GTP 3',8-cyclase
MVRRADGLEAALAAGIQRIKVNAVLLADMDDGEIERFMEWARVAPISVRFIELMDAGMGPGLFARHHLPISRVERLLEERGWSRLAPEQAGGPATDHGKAGHAGRIGVIAPRPKDACARCNRLRVSATGDLRLCLFDDRRVGLRQLLQSDAQRPALEAAIRNAVATKPTARPVEHRPERTLDSLASIGG